MYINGLIIGELLMAGGKIPVPLSERFWAKVPDQPGMDCWVWHGAKSTKGKSSPQGYGVIGTGSLSNHTRRNVFAHRVAYELCRGEIPAGMFVCHACDNPPCVNPSHLFLGNNSDNMKDASQKGRIRGSVYKGPPKTHCPEGHEYTDSNTYRYPDGRYKCRECGRARDRAAHRRSNTLKWAE